jgi:hypothetical protein
MSATATEPAKQKLSTATSKLFSVAVTIPVLRPIMGIEPSQDDSKIIFWKMSRPWLIPHPLDKNELTFDADLFAQKLGKCSSGENHCILFLLNVWNDGYARQKDWHFDLFKSLNTLSEDNRNGIAEFLQNPIWP